MYLAHLTMLAVVGNNTYMKYNPPPPPPMRGAIRQCHLNRTANGGPNDVLL